MKKLILFTITTLLLFNCSNNAPNEPNEPNEPPIPCNDGICLTDEQLNFFKEYLEDDTLTKKVLFEMSSIDLSSKSITSLDTGIFDNLTNLTRVDLTDNDICIVDKADVGLTDRVNLNFEIGQCLTDAQLTFFSDHISSITTKQELYEAPRLELQSKGIASIPTGIFNNLTSLTSVDLTDNTICVDKADVGLADSVTFNFDGWNCLTDAQFTFFSDHISSITTKQELYEAPTLNLSSKDITSLDTGIFDNLTNLTRVDLTGNDICIVDKADVGLTDRVNLNFENGQCITDDQLTFFSDHISSITTKQQLYEAPTLDLSSKSITSLDTGIFDNLTNLTRVDLTDNDICIVDKADVGLTDRVNLNFEIGQCLTDAQLTFFSDHISSITTKQELYEAPRLELQSKGIASIPTGIFNNLTSLTSVDLTDNTICVDKADVGLADSVTFNFDGWNCLTDAQLTFFSDHISSITTKQELYEAPSLYLQSKSISILPTGIFNNLTSLTTLDLDDNNLTSIPAEIGNLTSLTILDLDGNKLTSIPAEIGNLTSLTRLDLTDNNFTSIPAEIGNITSLTVLFIDDNNLTSIPDGIFTNLTKLESLWLTENNLTSIPTDIGNLTSLTDLNLYENKLTSIPKEIGNLTSLTNLTLYNNKLASLPDEIFKKLTNLTSLRLKNSSAVEMNSFDCNDTNYSTWGLDPMSLPTSFRCDT